MSGPRIELRCEQCREPMEFVRSTKRFCSPECYRAKRNGWPRTRECRLCGTPFLVMQRADANRQYCSKTCSKSASSKTVKDWQAVHTDEMKRYAQEWSERNPGHYKAVKVAQKLRTLELLGGACIVCGVTNQYWLHIDYIPTCRGLRFRHPRGFAYVQAHVEDFRLLCANHHYELTITGHIEGTDIVQ